MNVVYMTPTRAFPNYKTLDDLANELGVSKQTLHSRKKELEEEKERYGEYVVIRDAGIVLINYLAWIDFLTYRKKLKEKNARKYVPPYKPVEVAKALGWYGEEET